jgi:hypothetical protein
VRRAVRAGSRGLIVAHLVVRRCAGKGCKSVLGYEVFAHSIFNAPLTMTGANRAGDRFGH